MEEENAGRAAGPASHVRTAGKPRSILLGAL